MSQLHVFRFSFNHGWITPSKTRLNRDFLCQIFWALIRAELFSIRLGLNQREVSNNIWAVICNPAAGNNCRVSLNLSGMNVAQQHRNQIAPSTNHSLSDTGLYLHEMTCLKVLCISKSKLIWAKISNLFIPLQILSMENFQCYFSQDDISERDSVSGFERHFMMVTSTA